MHAARNGERGLVSGRLRATCAVAALVLAMGCLGCRGELAPSGEVSGSALEESKADSEVWRGFVEYRENTVYGSANGYEPMLDLVLGDDGSCTVTPLEGHDDLPSDVGTWEDLGEVVMLHFDSGLIELRVIDSARLEGDASSFGIEGFDFVVFDLFG